MQKAFIHSALNGARRKHLKAPIGHTTKSILPFGDSKRWSQSVGMCRHKVGSPVDGSGEVLLSPGCCYRKGPVHWGLLFLLRGLPVGHLRDLGGQ